MSNEVMKNGDILLYQNDTEKEFVNVVFYNENFWLTQKGMAELFDVNVPAISKHLQNITMKRNWSRAQRFPKWKQFKKKAAAW